MKQFGRVVLLSVLLVPSGSWAGGAARVVAGGVVGLAGGTAIAMGVIVARTVFQNHYLESTTDMMGGLGAPIPLGAVLGGVAGAAGPAVLASVAVAVVGGGAVGSAAGAVVGSLLSNDPSDAWAGGAIGGAIGVFLGFAVGWLVGRRRQATGPRTENGQDDPGPSGSPGGAGGSGAPGGSGGGGGSGGRGLRGIGTVVMATGLGLLIGGCSGEAGNDRTAEERPAAAEVPADAGATEDVVILIGDPGKARFRRYPVIPRVAAEVDAWSERIGRDSAVTVVNLGDIVYPEGMHQPTDPAFPMDSARVWDQTGVVRSATALAHDARMYFVAGNHDWGLHEDREGARRLRNLGAFLDRVRSRGPNVDLVPTAGSGIPHVVDIGDRLRLILLDTAWWLFDAEPGGKDAVVRGVRDAMAGAGDRQVVIAGHHPYQSAGPHGGFFPVWKSLGIRTVLYRSGALLQDVNSRPYRELRQRLEEVFVEAGRPLAWVGGHEHSLQIIAHDSAVAPRYSIVSGSASKLTGVGTIPGTLFQVSAPGYVMLVVREDGAVDVEVVAGPARYLSCPENEPTDLEWERCMKAGAAAFETVYSARLAEP